MLNARIEQCSELSYHQALIHRQQDYEAEIQKLRKLNKVKGVANMREGRDVIKKRQYMLENDDFMKAKNLYFDNQQRKE